MKYAAAMTLYHPDIEVIENLKRTALLFEKLYVYDNTESKPTYANDIRKANNIIYIWNGKNDGLPIAFNYMLNLAYKDKIDYLCTLDQDSIITKENIQSIKEFISHTFMSNIAIVAPYPTGTNDSNDKSIQNVKWVICSGSFLNLSIIKNNGILYDPAYFVDRFDADLCKQIKRKGLDIIRLNKIIMKHRCGENGSHSDLRNYYMFRNRYYYNYKYYSKPVAIVRIVLQNFRHFKWIIKGQSEIKKRIIVYKTAVNDYKKNRLGKISDQSLNLIK